MDKKNISQFDVKPTRNNKPRVLVDLDGVVRDFIGSLIHVYKVIYPDHSILPVTSRRLEDFFPIGEEIYKFMKSGYIEQIMEEPKKDIEIIDNHIGMIVIYLKTFIDCIDSLT